MNAWHAGLELPGLGKVDVTTELDSALNGADVVMALRNARRAAHPAG